MAWNPSDEPSCFMGGFTAVHGVAAVSVSTLPGSDEEYGFGAAFIVDSLETIQQAEVRTFVTETQLLSRGNAPDELLFDGEIMVIHGALGAIYLGWMGGPYFGELATGRTGDLHNARGMLWEGTLYWESVDATAPGWQRIRRRNAGETVNETFMQGDRRDFGSLRTDGTWATWLEDVDLDGDGRPDQSELYAAHTGGRMEPESWAKERIAIFAYPASAFDRPILTGGMLAMRPSSYEVRLFDLERRRTLSIAVPSDIPGFHWETVLHLGPEYLFLTYSYATPMDGMRRYRIADLVGWEPL
jgi:hypothetical protein